MHLVSSENTPVIPFSNTSWLKFLQCAHLWLNLQSCKESEVARNALEILNLKDDQEVPANVGYHRKCYMRFTNEAHIERAQKKKEKATKDSEGLYPVYDFLFAFIRLCLCTHQDLILYSTVIV